MVPLRVFTSQSHPLVIDWLPAELHKSAGAVGMTSAPGKRTEHGIHGAHRRSMTADLAQLAGADLLVTLMEMGELLDCGMSDLELAARARGLGWEHHPIRDLSIPADLRAFHETVRSVCGLVRRNRKRVVVHCRGGHGRTGLFVACMLTRFGYTAAASIELVRATRKGTIHNAAQEDFVHLFQQTTRLFDLASETP